MKGMTSSVSIGQAPKIRMPVSNVSFGFLQLRILPFSEFRALRLLGSPTGMSKPLNFEPK